jgi:hypothetical protein
MSDRPDRQQPDYAPTRSTRFYPGAALSDERKRQILDYELELDEATVDDILFNTAAAFTGTFYAVVALIEERWGKDEARAIARELGARNGQRNLEKWLARHGVEKGSPMLMSKFQDFQHAMRGPDHANALSEYDGRRARACRSRCGWHTGRPEGAESYCRHFSETAIAGYGAADLGLHEIRVVRCMSWGDGDCEHEFWYAEPLPAEADPRHVWRRSDGGS